MDAPATGEITAEQYKKEINDIIEVTELGVIDKQHEVDSLAKSITAAKELQFRAPLPQNQQDQVLEYYRGQQQKYHEKALEAYEQQNGAAEEAARYQRREQRTRASAEHTRANAENARENAQNARDDAQDTRGAAQYARTNPEDAREIAQDAREIARDARDDAQISRNNAQVSGKSAQNARDDAQVSRDDAQFARDDTQIARQRAYYERGNKEIADGYNAAAAGLDAAADGHTTAADGHTTVAAGYRAASDGERTAANGFDAAAHGYQTTAAGLDTAAGGYQTAAAGFDAAAHGYQTAAGGLGTAAGGHSKAATGYSAAAEGFKRVGDGCAEQERKWQTLADALEQRIAQDDTTGEQLRAQANAAAQNVREHAQQLEEALTAESNLSARGRAFQLFSTNFTTPPPPSVGATPTSPSLVVYDHSGIRAAVAAMRQIIAKARANLVEISQAKQRLLAGAYGASTAATEERLDQLEGVTRRVIIAAEATLRNLGDTDHEVEQLDRRFANEFSP